VLGTSCPRENGKKISRSDGNRKYIKWDLLIFRCAITVVFVDKDQSKKQVSYNTTAFGIYF
jgi:hypothetical protein